MTSAKVKWKWTPEHQEAFEQMRALMAKETLVTFPDCTKEFEIHTDASNLQLGACHTRWQASSIALTQAKSSPNVYTTTERKLPSVVETLLKEVRNIQLGQRIKVHTDHENLTYQNSQLRSSYEMEIIYQRIFSCSTYIRGTNVVADALSRLKMIEAPFENTKEISLD
jgi:RNase H-like domain found in reverse transcriptase